MEQYIEPDKHKPFLCTLLEAEGLLGGDDAALALTVWRRRRARSGRVAFGEVVLGLGLVHPVRLAEVVRLQRKLAGPPGSRPLGMLLVQHGVVKPRHLAAALDRRAPAQRLGELLLHQGLVQRMHLDLLLQLQRRQRRNLAS